MHGLFQEKLARDAETKVPADNIVIIYRARICFIVLEHKYNYKR